MAEIVREWLQDCALLDPEHIQSFANTLEHNQMLVAALHSVLEERGRYAELVDPVCSQLLDLYRRKQKELQRFTMQFLPTLIFVYLNSVAHGDKKSCRSVETLLVALYNLEVVDENDQEKIVSFRMPSLAQASIYHEPSTFAPLTESSLRRWECCDSNPITWGPLPQVEVLNAQNRLKVLTALMFVYNQQLSVASKSALEYLCKVCSKLVTQGFSKTGHHQRSSYGSDSSLVPRLLPRIPVSPPFLLELLHAVYFAMFNSQGSAQLAIEDLHNRACYECYSEVLLVTGAIRNYIQTNSTGQTNEGSMGLALGPPATTTPVVSKSMITNASFRTKKLPDDIPIQDETASGEKNLSSITEEQEGESERLTPRGSSLRTKEKKLPNFPGLKKSGSNASSKVSQAKSNGTAIVEKKSVERKRSSTETNGPLILQDSPDSAICEGQAAEQIPEGIVEVDLRSSVQVSSV